ncbi:putative UDP-arabinose 4-epimerase 2, partial [Tetrabaena socialis]
MANPLQYYHNVTVNTVNLLECMEETGVEQLVYSSTCAVYGNPDKLPVTELTPPVPINPYGQSKLMAEEVIRWHSRSHPRFKSIIFRYFNVYGSDPEGRLGARQGRE